MQILERVYPHQSPYRVSDNGVDVFFCNYKHEAEAFIRGVNHATRKHAQESLTKRPESVRGFLSRIYAEWKNNYLSPAVFAEHQEITEDEGKALIELARSVFYSKNPNQ